MIGDILQPTHLLFILVVALLVLGPKRLPEVGRAVGKGLRDFRGALNGEEPTPEQQVLQHTAADNPAPAMQATAADSAAPAKEPAEHPG